MPQCLPLLMLVKPENKVEFLRTIFPGLILFLSRIQVLTARSCSCCWEQFHAASHGRTARKVVITTVAGIYLHIIHTRYFFFSSLLVLSQTFVDVTEIRGH